MSDTEGLSRPPLPTGREVRDRLAREGGPRSGDSGTLGAVLKRVGIGSVLVILLSVIGTLLSIVASGYGQRLEGVEQELKTHSEVQIKVDRDQDKEFEAYQKLQNGHLHRIDLELQGIRVEQKYTREAIQRIEVQLKNR